MGLADQKDWDGLRVMQVYKHSEVGLIPEDWDVLPLGKLVRSVEYGSAAKSGFKGAIPVLRMGNLRGGKIDWSDLVYTDDIDEIDKYKLQPNDVLFNRTNTIDLVGKTSIYDGSSPAIFAGYLIRINVVMELLDSSFLNYVLNTEFSRKHSAKVLSIAVGQANINGQKLKTYPIPLPPTKTEQVAIATALSDLDGLLAALDRLITKKRDLKHAAMQQLLTGQTRLPGFHGKWKAKQLGDLITHCFSGATPRRNRPDFYKGNVRWITSGELNYNTITDTIEKITSEAVAKTNLAIIPKGTFLIAITGLEAAGTRGSCGIVGEQSTTNQSCMAIFPTIELVTEYLFHFYVYRGDALAMKYCQGTKQQSYTAKLVKKLPIDVPPTTIEQTAIAEVLTEMDAELVLLTQRRDKTRALKQAMMQELLTGKTRLV